MRIPDRRLQLNLPSEDTAPDELLRRYLAERCQGVADV
jgi:hypothetical protein